MDRLTKLCQNEMRHIRTKQVLCGDIGNIWNYVSKPRHLEYLTPPWMKFHILNRHHFKGISAGLVIEYKIKVFPYLPFRYKWKTQIGEVITGKQFEYEQQIGPYSYWRHEIQLIHTGQSDTVTLVDDYQYQMPYGIIGEVMHTMFVANVLDEIRAHRMHKLDELFKT
mmetsp:Transcript_68678/g.109087  ORF Transcript_68678/g.109087 Transcript_68678/m.109087 type:complete len:167 (+) Transcript_68678:22-522(+)